MMNITLHYKIKAVSAINNKPNKIQFRIKPIDL